MSAKLLPAWIALVVVSGCGAEVAQAPEIVWPAAPEKPRIKYLRSLSSENDVRKRSRVVEAIAGEADTVALGKPYGVCVDREGRVYVSDTALGKVLMWDIDGGEFRKIGDAAGPGGLAKAINVACSENGTLYVSDGLRRTVNVYDREANFLFAVGGKDVFGRPTGLAVDDERKRLYVVDTGAHDVKVFSLGGKLLHTIGKRGSAEGEFNFPTNACVDSAGKLYVADSFNFRIQVFTPGWEYLMKIGTIGTGRGQFSKLKGVAVDSEGHIYAVDAAFANVQIFDQLGRLLLYFGSGGGKPGQFSLPAGTFVDHRDRVYVVDQMNRRVQVFQYLGKKYAEEQQGRR